MHICIHTRTYLRACSHISMDVCARVLTVCDSDYAKTKTVHNSNCARDSCAQCTCPLSLPCFLSTVGLQPIIVLERAHRGEAGTRATWRW